MTTSQSTQVLNVGDYVKTSKGNIGVIEKKKGIIYLNQNKTMVKILV